MKTAVVTGVTGFFGGALAEEILKNGWGVYGVGRDATKIEWLNSYSNFTFIQAKFEEYDRLTEKIAERNIDVFFHFAWSGGFTDNIKNYHMQMKNAAYVGDAVAAAAGLECKKFVYAGTYNEYEIMTLLLGANLSPRYTCIYAVGKTAGDVIARTMANNLGIEYNVGFVPMPYGERNESAQLVNVVINCLLKGDSPKLIDGNNLYDLVYIRDIAKAFISIAEFGKNQKAYYIGHRKLRKFREWMSDMRDIVSPGTELKFGEYDDKQIIDFSLVDFDALYRDTGFECSEDFNESMLSTVRWIKEKLEM